jgi:hypothetical protein
LTIASLLPHVTSGYNRASRHSHYGSTGSAKNATIQFTCPDCSHTMQLPPRRPTATTMAFGKSGMPAQLPGSEQAREAQ